MRPIRAFSFLGALGIVTCVACNDDHDTRSVTLDGGVLADSSTMSGDDAAAPPTQLDCYPNPTTYLELINACTDAEKVTKHPTLPLLMVDGGLPPIP